MRAVLLTVLTYYYVIVTMTKAEEDGCFNSTQMDNLIESIRQRSIRMARYEGAHNCVRTRIDSMQPVDEYRRDGALVKCYDAKSISTSVVECAYESERVM